MIKNLIKRIRRKWHSDLIKPNQPNQLILLNNIWEVTQNINYCLNKNYCVTSEYLFFKEIHESLPLYAYSTDKLMRLGRSSDGGYILPVGLSSTKIAYSFGISNDVSWNLDMVRYGYEVYQYDHTIDKLPEENEHFHWNKIGIGSCDSGCIHRIDTILKDNQHSDISGMILKMDIEGAEWGALDVLDANLLKQFDVIVMEIHGLTDHDDHDLRIRVLNKLSHLFYMIHIHGNICRRVCFYGDLITPDVCEVTLINKNLGELTLETSNRPIYLDHSNIESFVDLYLNNWNPIK